MKKATMSLNIVIMAILGLLVLIVLMFIFRDQISSAASNYFSIGKDATDGAKGDKCVTLVSVASRQCSATDCETGWQEIYPSGEEFTDCKDGKKCCEKFG